MNQTVYRTGNHENARSLGNQLLFVLVAVMFGPLLVVALVLLKNGCSTMGFKFMCYPFGIFLALFLTMRFYGRAFRNLAFAMTDQGVRIRFFGSVLISWKEIRSIEKVNPFRLDLVRAGGFQYDDFCHGVFTSRLGRMRVWWTGEKDAVLIRTAYNAYLLAPEKIDEFMQTVESRIGR